MSKASEIVNGIYNTLIRKSDVEVIAKARMEVCQTCSHIVKEPLERCGICHCVLKMKTRSIKSECPKKKWMKIKD